MRKFSVLGAVIAVLVFAVPTFAVEAATLDYGADVTAGLAGFMAGAAASIAAGFAIAILLRATWKAARVALKAVGLIR